MVMPDLSKIPKPGYDSLKLIERQDWGALPPKETGEEEKLKTPVNFVVLNHTNTEPCKEKEECMKIVQEMQRNHMEELGLSDIQYNYVVGADGHTYVGRGWNTKPPKNPLCPEVYDKSLEIMFIGSYVDEPLLPKLTTPAYDLIQVLLDKEVIHEDFKFKRLVKFKQQEEEDVRVDL